MNARIDPPSDTADREIITTRLLDAPRDLVFAAWTDPEHVARWWGPRGFTITSHEMDVQPGGVWRFTMYGPDGTEYANRIVFTAVEAPALLSYEHGGDDEHPNFHVTVRFDEEGERTRVTMRHLLATVAERDRVVGFGAAELGQQTLTCLAEYVASLDAEVFVLVREFDAPRELVFRAWTEADQLTRWWGPAGFTMAGVHLELRPGGSFHYSMRGPDESEMWGKFVFREIDPPARLVLVNGFSNPAGERTRHPGAPGWPREMLITVDFREQGGKTTVALRSIPIHASAAERATFRAGHASMAGGFGASFEQLREHLATLRG